MATLREMSWDIPADPQAVGKIRELVRDALFSWGLDPELAEDLEVVASELSTNAILHGRPPITFTLKQAGPCIGGEVTDCGDWGIPRQRESSENAAEGDNDEDDSDEHGRGLPIVAALVDEWGIEFANDHAGTAVWFRLCP